MKQFCVYILECNDGSFYTGLTSDLEGRMTKHNTGFYPGCYTFRRRPLKLVFHQEFQNFDQAMQFEKQVKGWSRKKKLALIEGRLEDLPELSKNYTQFTLRQAQGDGVKGSG